MNNARMWTIVSPSVGVPVFFIALAVTSLVIHGIVLTNTTWLPAFFQGAAGG
jgi:light-harvesting protein B-800-850 alpha chain